MDFDMRKNQPLKEMEKLDGFWHGKKSMDFLDMRNGSGLRDFVSISSHRDGAHHGGFRVPYTLSTLG
jgi:hypothetical protein